MLRTIPVYIAALLLAACSVADLPIVFRPDLEQGAPIEEQAVAQLERGMTRQQVNFLLGTPSVDHPFSEDRWDYLYQKRDGYGELIESRRLTIFFEGDRVVRAEGNALPEGSPLRTGAQDS